MFGIRSPDVREKLINKGSELTLQQCIDITRTHELGKAQAQEIGHAEDQVHSISKKSKRRSGPKNTQRKPGRQDNLCGKCGRSHSTSTESCPAKGMKCYKCDKLNHFASVCRTVKKKSTKVNEVCNYNLPDLNSSNSEEKFSIDTVSYEQKYTNSKCHSFGWTK